MASILTSEILSYLGSGSSEPLLEEDVVLILRSSHAGGFSSGGFQWPPEGPVEAKDWNPEPICGYGLHGFLWGEGDGSLAKWEFDAVWQVVAVSGHDLVDLDNGEKVKFPRGWVMYSGTLEEAVRRIAECAPRDAAIIGRIASVGDNQSVTVGYKGTATAGHNGRATAGHYGIAQVGSFGKAQTGDWGQATVGDYGHAIAEWHGRATAGHNGQATTGYEGFSQVGEGGYAITGEYGHAKAGVNGTISIKWWDRSYERSRTKVAHVGEDGIKPNVWYKLDLSGNFVEVKE